MNYLAHNATYWANLYNAPNVESFIFRFYGRILVHDYHITGDNHETILDFGCGQGAALKYFDSLGFDCYGVDIAKNDIDIARSLVPNASFRVIDPQPYNSRKYFQGNFDIVISIQTLDFLSNTDFDKAIFSLYNNMKPGAFIYASMSGWDMYYRQHATYVGDGLWHVKFKNDRIALDLFLNFIRDKAEMRERFRLFKPIYLDYYDSSFREEGSEHRFTFFGQKQG